jgi:ATP-binding cassette subfamily B protein
MRIRAELVDKLYDLGPAHVVRRRVGDVQATLVDGVEALQGYVGFYLPQAVVAVVVPAGIVIFLATLDIWVATTVVIAVVIVPLARQIWAKILGERGKAHWAAYAEYAAKTTDALQGMSTLVALGAAGRHGDRLAREGERLREATTRNLGASLGVITVTATAMGLGTGISVAVAALRHATGALEAASVLLVLFLAAECFRPLSDLQNYWHEGFYGLAAGNGICELLDAEPEVADKPDVIPQDVARPPRLTFANVSFRYPGSERAALNDVTFEVAAGATLAVVGRSGAGKSTLTQLVQRVFDPTAGVVRVDGRDLRDLPLDQVRGQVAVVSQDVMLFHASVEENVRLARPDAPDQEVERAIQLARVDELAGRLPQGLASQVGERGSRLSGGERQRVAIARALLRDAPILILDEATSSLDGANEAAITAGLAQIRRDRTTIVVAHRLSTVADADLVAVFDNGHLIEFGPPQQLRTQPGTWAELVAAQAKGATR